MGRPGKSSGETPGLLQYWVHGSSAPADPPAGLLPGPAFVTQVQGFNFFSGPGGPSQKLEAGFDARVMSKTPDADDPSHFLPAMKFHQLGQDHFQSDAVKRVVGLLFSHVLA